MCNVFITNYESLRKFFVVRIDDSSRFTQRSIEYDRGKDIFRAVIIDESHKCKTNKTQQSKFVEGICKGKRWVFELTGTPVVNNNTDIIQQLKAVAEEAAADAQETVMKLVDEYQSIGHVPYKEKDKLYKEYHAVTDKIYKELNISTARRRLDNFKSNLKDMAKRGEDALDNERARLFRQYENIKQEVQTYENNLGFLNASSKKGSSLIDEMNRKVQKLKDDMNLVREKIKAIDAENREQE